MIKEGEIVNRDQVLAQVDADKIENQLEELEINSREIDINGEKTSKKINSWIPISNTCASRYSVPTIKREEIYPGEQLETMELKLLEAETSRFDLKKTLETFTVQKEKIRNKREYLQLLLEDHTLKSPWWGRGGKICFTGETVLPGTAIADILDTSSLYVEIFIEGKEIAV